MTKIPTPEDVLAYWIGDTRHSVGQHIFGGGYTGSAIRAILPKT